MTKSRSVSELGSRDLLLSRRVSKQQTYPRTWMMSPLRWYATPITWISVWGLLRQGISRFRRGDIFNFLSEIPGEDDLVVMRSVLGRSLLVRSPELAMQVLAVNQDNYEISAEYDMLAVGLGRGLITNRDQDQWDRNKRLVQPIFARQNLGKFAQPIVDVANDAVDRIIVLADGGRDVDVHAEMNRMTLDVVARTMFGTRLSKDMSEIRFQRMLRLFGIGFLLNTSLPLFALAKRFNRPILGWGGGGANSRWQMGVMRAVGWMIAPRAILDLKHIERVADGLISDYRNGRTAKKDNLLAALIDAHDPVTGDRFTDREIHDELMTFIGAGTETTSTVLTWTWKLLAENPIARQRMYDELRTVLGDREPTLDDVADLEWTKAVLSEAMRIYPPVIGLTRIAKGDDVLGGVNIPAGTAIAVLIQGLHHNTRVWKDHETFDPSRFLTENMSKTQKLAHMPFGAGRRKCVASLFATAESVLLLATVARRLQFDFGSTGTCPSSSQHSFLGGPDGPVWMNVAARPCSTSLA